MKKRRKSAIPEFIRPQLARLVETPPSGDEWIHEVKYDGYRALCRIEGSEVTFRTRNGLDWTQKFFGLIKEARQLDVKSALLDGEIVAIDPDGRTSFSGLQKALSENRSDQLVYYAFDLLFLDGEDLQEQPLLKRKQALQSLIERSDCDRILFSDHWRSDGRTMLKASCRHRLEGIISKNADDAYHSGRGESWLKSKCKSGQEFVIGGYTRPEGSRHGFGALLLGVYEPTGELRYVGKVGTGFDSKQLTTIAKKLKAAVSDDSPFAEFGESKKGVTWVEPRLVANVEFGGWTADGMLRHASFQGLREDKSSRAVTREEPSRLTHPDRVVFPERGLTKQDVFDYYSLVSERILPHLTERPLSLLRCPDGQGKTCFFQKHGEGQDLISASTETELLHWIQMGALEIHPRGSRFENLENADVLVFDLDPGEGVSWKQICDGAEETRDLLKALGLKSFVKLSGGKGLHVQVPIAPRYPWSTIKAFCKSVALELARRHPEKYTAQLAKSHRPGKIFIDYLRNGEGATAVAPYSLRARASAGVAAPITWAELKSIRSGDQFSISDMKKRLRKADPWKGYYELKQEIAVLEKSRSGTIAGAKRRS